MEPDSVTIRVPSKFPLGIYDFKWNLSLINKLKEMSNLKHVLIATNQGGIELGHVDLEHFNIKLQFICACMEERLGVPVVGLHCPSNSPTHAWRKPNTGMLEVFEEYNVPACTSRDKWLFIGDASGKSGQFSDSDLMCAKRFGIDYIDVYDFIKQ